MLVNGDIVAKVDALGLPKGDVPYIARIEEKAETYSFWEVLNVGTMRGDGNLHGVVLGRVSDEHFLGHDVDPDDEFEQTRLRENARMVSESERIENARQAADAQREAART